ncbi:MAG: hypothetical protein AB7K24_15940 [Gemmataceae bacterium]
MALFAPDVLAAAHGLSLGLCIAGLVVGMLLWATGWLWHRFWIVLFTTVVGGMAGLMTTPWHGIEKPLVAGLLLAIAAGVLALALVRLVVFSAGGVALCLAIRALAPAAWNEPLVWFLSGGLVGLLLFKLWTMALTSYTGSLLGGYSLILLLDKLGRVDAVELAEKRHIMLNAACLAVALLGLVLQFFLERRRVHNELMREEQFRQMEEREQELLYGRRWWQGWRRYRRAG